MGNRHAIFSLSFSLVFFVAGGIALHSSQATELPKNASISECEVLLDPILQRQLAEKNRAETLERAKYGLPPRRPARTIRTEEEELLDRPLWRQIDRLLPVGLIRARVEKNLPLNSDSAAILQQTYNAANYIATNWVNLMMRSITEPSELFGLTLDPLTFEPQSSETNAGKWIELSDKKDKSILANTALTLNDLIDIKRSFYSSIVDYCKRHGSLEIPGRRVLVWTEPNAFSIRHRRLASLP